MLHVLEKIKLDRHKGSVHWFLNIEILYYDNIKSRRKNETGDDMNYMKVLQSISPLHWNRKRWES